MRNRSCRPIPLARDLSALGASSLRKTCHFWGQYLRSHLPATLVELPYGTPSCMGLQFWSFERNVGIRRFIVLPRLRDSHLDHVRNLVLREMSVCAVHLLPRVEGLSSRPFHHFSEFDPGSWAGPLCLPFGWYNFFEPQRNWCCLRPRSAAVGKLSLPGRNLPHGQVLSLSLPNFQTHAPNGCLVSQGVTLQDVAVNYETH